MAAMKTKAYSKNTNTYNLNVNISFLKKENTHPCMKIWRWRYKRYLCNHGFLQCEKFECLKFRHAEIIHKKRFLSFVKMHNCLWYLWTCPSQITGFHNFGGQIGLGYSFGRKWTIVTFFKVLRPMIVKCLNEKKPYENHKVF